MTTGMRSGPPRLNLADLPAATVHTKYYVQAQTIAKTALRHSFIGGIFGPPGTGKSTAVQDFLASSDVPSIYI